MAKLTRDKLIEIRDKARSARLLGKKGIRAKITVHMGTCGIASGATKIFERLNQLIQDCNKQDIHLVASSCAGLCSREPIVTIQVVGNPPTKYADLTEAKINKIFKQHVIDGKIVRQYLLAIGSEMTC